MHFTEYLEEMYKIADKQLADNKYRYKNNPDKEFNRTEYIIELVKMTVDHWVEDYFLTRSSGSLEYKYKPTYDELIAKLLKKRPDLIVEKIK